MKKAYLPLLMLLLLLVSMQSACAEQVSLVSIWNNFVCPNCGTKTVPDYDSTHHWLYCPTCNLDHYASCHYSACTDTVTCTVCSASGIYFDFLEHGEDIPKQDELYHWHQCSDCGALSTRELHTSEDGSDVCSGCGLSEGIFITSDEHHYRYGFNSSGHWLVCTDCNEVLTEGPHTANCDYPNYCTICKAAGALVNVPEEELHHTYRYTITADSHSGVCRDCGKSTGTEAHYRSCISPTAVCEGCGTKNAAGISIQHGRISHSLQDALYCSSLCWSCFDTLAPVRHDLDSTNTCRQCQMMIGDMDLSNTFDEQDILILLQSLAGWDVSPFVALCDTGNDGRIDPIDVEYVLQLHFVFEPVL